MILITFLRKEQVFVGSGRLARLDWAAPGCAEWGWATVTGGGRNGWHKAGLDSGAGLREQAEATTGDASFLRSVWGIVRRTYRILCDAYVKLTLDIDKHTK